MRRALRIGKTTTLACATLALSSLSYGLDIHLNANASLLGNADALGAFRRAADTWERVLADDIKVTIDAGLESLGSSVLGGTRNVSLVAGYDLFRGLMVADEASDVSGVDPVVGALPDPIDLSFYLPNGFSLAGGIGASKANIKALGVGGLDDFFGESDGEINFSSDFAFDFDNSDGVGAGLFDFESVALHEIGHLLGFTSAVDDIDFLIENQLFEAIVPTVLDLFRFASIPGFFPTSLAEFSVMPRALIPGLPSHFDTVWVKVPMSTGFFTGDGSQASHWLDNSDIGIMDPTLAPQEIGSVSYADLLSMDVIGWDLRAVPDVGSSFNLLLLGLGSMAIWARRKSRRNVNS